MASNDVVPKAGGSSGCGMVVPWPRHDIVDAWPLASPILAVFDAPALQLTPGRAMISVPLSAEGR